MMKIISKISIVLLTALIAVTLSSCSSKSALDIDIDAVKPFKSNSFERVNNSHVIVAPASKEAVEDLDSNGPEDIKNSIRGSLERIGIKEGNDLTIKVSLETQKEGIGGTVYYYDKNMELLAELNIFADARKSHTTLLAAVDRGFVNEVVAYAKKHFIIVK